MKLSALYRSVAGSVIVACAVGVLTPVAAVAIVRPASVEASGDDDTTTGAIDDSAPSDAVPEDQRDDLLGEGWQASSDVAWAISGDGDGLDVLVAPAAEGYAWSRVATLAVAGFETDRWVGNACLSSLADWLAVVYAPRSFSNREDLLNHGAFGALVNLSTGEVADLGSGYSLAYFNPGCGRGQRIAMSQFSEDGQTRLSMIDATTGEQSMVVTVDEPVTSAVPVEDGFVGSNGGSIVHVGSDGSESTIEDPDGIPFGVVVNDNGLAYLAHDGERATATFVATGGDGSTEVLAEGDLTSVGLAADATGTIHVIGDPDTVTVQAPEGVAISPGVGQLAEFSSDGDLAVESAYRQAGQTGAVPNSASASEVSIQARVVDSSSDVTFGVDPTETGPAPTTEDVSGGGSSFSDGLQGGASFGAEPASIAVSGVGDDPISTGSPCAVARNDPAIQAYQPTSAEVEWTVDQEIRQTLVPSFPLPALTGGGRVPAQIMLGVLAQESNFWQASKYAVPGVTGNPLVGNFYGVNRDSSDPSAWWQINYANADCGYGIAQVTDQMRTGQMTYSKQLAIATDYQANIARGLQILIDKWNQTKAAGLTINNGDPAFMENWFYALWAYNTGFYAQSGTSPWGVGWSNNPINPIYPANRGSFLDGRPEDAATPQLWPYPERVLGFAANSVQFVQSVNQTNLGDVYNYGPAFTPAWWTASDGVDGVFNRRTVKPPVALFCNSTNSCLASATDAQGPCRRADYKCWFNQPATWKSNCASLCGYEYMTYSLGSAKPAAANSYPPNCSRSPLPSNALIIDNLPNGTAARRSGCTPVATTGSFQFTFAGSASNQYPSKVDLHQLGSGFNGQFYFTHTRIPGSSAAFNGALDVSGTWSLGSALNQWATVYVHMPNHGAWTQQANYVISTGSRTVTRSANQKNYANQWVSLGTLQFSGVPTIQLDNHSARYGSNTALRDALSGSDDIAWDAVAFVPLSAKPSDFIVSMGDSFSSGEGTSPSDGSGFFRGSDHDGTRVPNSSGVYVPDPSRNACHRSPNAWPYAIDPPGTPSVDAVSSYLTPDPSNPVDFQMLACAGAVTNNVETSTTQGASQQYGELGQIDRGFLDSNTTLVTMTIGGNDIGFGQVIMNCFNAGLGGTSGPACADTPYASGSSTTTGATVDASLAALPAKVTTVLQQVHTAAPNAKIVMLGYPTIFETLGSCVGVRDGDLPWLNSVADRLNSALTKAAQTAGSYVTYQSPQYAFQGKNLCQNPTAMNGFVLDLTPGDLPIWQYTGPGPNFGVPLSAQSVHPNTTGAALYAQVVNSAIRMQRVPLSGSLVGAAGVTYYSTPRLHANGPASMNVTSFSSCGTEIRFGLRKDDGSGAYGQQSTNSLSWTQPQAMRDFMWTATSPAHYGLESGNYLLNGRLVTACSGGAAQPWTAELWW